MADWAVAISDLNDAVEETFSQVDPVTYSPVNAASFSLTAIIDRAIPTETLAPGVHVVLSARVSDFTVSPARGDSFTVGTKTYAVHEVQDDGQGMVKVIGQLVGM